VPDHTVGHRYLKAVEILNRSVDGLRNWSLLSQETRTRLFRDEEFRPEHWVVPAADELGTDPLAILYGDEYILHRSLDPESMLDSVTLESIRNMAVVADEQEWTWTKRDDVWRRHATRLFARNTTLVGAKPISIAKWSLFGREYDNERQQQNQLTPRGDEVRTPSSAYVCKRCGEDLTRPFCDACKSDRDIRPA